jgi:transcription initiation factor TFIID subunit 9B
MASQNPPTTTQNGTDPQPEMPDPRPRDARLIHALLSSQGVTAYQDRVPLMLIDYAYRYTRGVLADAASLAAEGYGLSGGPPATGKSAATQDDINMTSLRLAAASRQISQFQPGLGKQDLLEMGMETNKIGLPRVEREFGVRLPSERYLLTGSGFALQDEWEEEAPLEDLPPVDNKLNAADEVEAADGLDDPDTGMLDDEDMEEDEFEEVMGINQDHKMGGT